MFKLNFTFFPSLSLGYNENFYWIFSENDFDLKRFMIYKGENSQAFLQGIVLRDCPYLLLFLFTLMLKTQLSYIFHLE